MADQPLTYEVYEAFQRVEFERWDAVIAADLRINTPAGWGLQGLDTLKGWAGAFAQLAKQIDLVDEHLALDAQGTGRGFITFNLHWKHTDAFFDLAPTGREGTAVETLLLTITDHKVVQIDVADNTFDLAIYLWERNWPHPHNVRPEPLVVGLDRRALAA